MSTCKYITDNLAPCGRDTHTGSRFCDDHGGVSKDEATYHLAENGFCPKGNIDCPSCVGITITGFKTQDAKTEADWLSHILYEYAHIDDSELGEDKFMGDYNLQKARDAINARFEAALGEDDPEVNEPGSITEAGIRLKFGDATHNTLRTQARNRWYQGDKHGV